VKRARFLLAPWKWEVVIFVGGKPAEVEREVRRIGIDIQSGELRDGSTGHTWMLIGAPAVLWVRTLRDIPTLAHECYHVVHGMLEGRGVKSCEASEEAFTYTLESLMRGILSCKALRGGAVPPRKG
jgi:hypothetical protein